MGTAHFIGIGGVGMTATAMLLREAGWEISGTDPFCHPPSSNFLAERGIRVHSEYAVGNIPAATTLVVAGGSAKVDPSLNEEVAAAHRRGIPVKSFPQVVAELTGTARNIVVAGSYGKSSCTTLLAWILESAGKEPGYFIGAFPQQLPGPSKLGGGEHFVLEGDEYLTSGLDPTSKFLYLEADDVLLTSLEHDHVNIFASQKSYLEPYERLVDGLPSDGVLVGCTDDPWMSALLTDSNCRTVTYGLNQAAGPCWSAARVVFGETTEFDLVREGSRVARLRTTLMGWHNVQNIVGCAAVSLERGLVTPAELATAVASFEGLQRRLDLISKRGELVSAYEGFGSSYPKARAAIEAMRTHLAGRRLVALFEPNTFSWRHRAMLYWYEDAFEGVDEVLVYKTPGSGSNLDDELSHDEILEAVRNRHPGAVGLATPEEGLAALEECLREGDVLLVLTSGDMGGLVSAIPGFISERFSAP